MDAANFRFDHTLGPIYGWFSPAGLRWLALCTYGKPDAKITVLHTVANDLRGKNLHDALESYFAGIRQDFANIPLDLSGATPFRRAVWDAARTVPWGATLSYGELAVHIGRTKGATRAVGQALGANPIPILIPCHRILAEDGGLREFSCGLDWKRELLHIEGHARTV
jgi:methylated-DNA-[protein]-cysteine S-methyltransferase